MRIFISGLVYLCLPSLLLAQSIDWNHTYTEPEPVPGQSRWYSPRHILPLSDGGFVISSMIRAGTSTGLLRLDGDGKLIWNQRISDSTNVIYPELGWKEEADIFPNFSFENEDGTVRFVGESMIRFRQDGAGTIYLTDVDINTGRLLDTLAGFRDTMGSITMYNPIFRNLDGDFVIGTIYPFASSEHAYEYHVYNTDSSGRYYPTGSARELRRWYRPGAQFTDPQAYGANLGILDRDGGYVFWGGTGKLNALFPIPFLLKIAPDGTEVWSANPRAHTYGIASAIDTALAAGYITTYDYRHYNESREVTRQDLVIMKVDENGEMEWNLNLGDGRYYFAQNVRTLPDGSYIIAGFTGANGEESGKFEEETTQFYLAHVSIEGELLWEKEWGESGMINKLKAMAVLPDRRIVVAGEQGGELYMAKVQIGTSSVEQTSSRRYRLDLSTRR